MSKHEGENNPDHGLDRENILKEFEYQKSHIEEITGLTLSNIEAVGLRKITEEVMRQIEQDHIMGVGGNMTVSETEEIPARFFLEFYDIPIGQFDVLFSRGSQRIEVQTRNSLQPSESTKEYFQREQEKRHLI